ncbi:MAG: nucleotidyltransferase family protein [Elusimicrobiales bacterium]
MICGIILAAGASSRMGRPKALLEYRGGTFLDAVCSAMHGAGVHSITVVMGAHAAEIRGKWPGRHTHALVNPHPEQGQLSSLKTALRNMPVYAGAAVMALVDQPEVSSAVYEKLIDAWRQNPGCIAIPRHRGKRGHPIILDARVWPLCFEAPPDKGLHWVTHHGSVSVIDVDVDEESVIRDIDTPEQYAVLTRSRHDE